MGVKGYIHYGMGMGDIILDILVVTIVLLVNILIFYFWKKASKRKVYYIIAFSILFTIYILSNITNWNSIFNRLSS